MHPPGFVLGETVFIWSQCFDNAAEPDPQEGLQTAQREGRRGIHCRAKGKGRRQKIASPGLPHEYSRHSYSLVYYKNKVDEIGSFVPLCKLEKKANFSRDFETMETFARV
jgi:hypothetical protein